MATRVEAAGKSGRAVVLRVAVALPVDAHDFLPPHGEPLPPVGAVIAVPWRTGHRPSVVLGHEQAAMDRAFTLKEALPRPGGEPHVSTAGMRALEMLARDFLVPVGAVLAAHAPAGLNLPVEVEVRALGGDEGLPAALAKGRWVRQEKLDPALLAGLRGAGRVAERTRLAGPERDVLVAGAVSGDELTEKQRRLVDALREIGEAASAGELARAAGVSVDVVTRLVKHGVIRRVTRPRLDSPSLKAPAPTAITPAVWPEPAPVRLSGASRAERLAQLAAWIARVRDRGDGALVICPDLATFDRAWEALGGSGARPYTSAMPITERLWIEDRVRAGEVRVVIGTPVAWLLPVRDLALVAALADGAEGPPRAPLGAVNHTQIVLALSAASGAAAIVEGALHRPETVVAAGAVVHLPGAPPRVQTDRAPVRDPLSNTLRHTLLQVRDRGRQAVLIAGRRGYSAALVCPACGWRGECPRCDLRLRYHRSDRRLICHRCGHEEDAPAACPQCGGEAIEPRGTGTQWVATAVKRLLGEFPVLRWDRDRRDDVASLLAGGPGVIVGTRAVARLPALPGLSLIAMVDPDTALAIPDFRSPERVLRAALEALDLAPPGRRPLVVVQTAFPDDAVWRAFGRLDAEEWLQGELERRTAAGLPPHRKLVRLEVSGRRLAAVEEAADRIAERARRDLPEADVHGPAPAPVARIRDRHLRQVLVAGPADWTGAELSRIAGSGLPGVRIAIEVDPRDLSAPDRPDASDPRLARRPLDSKAT